MPATTSSISRSTPADFDQTGLSLPPPAKFGLKTSEHKRDNTNPVPDPIPTPVQTPILQQLHFDVGEYEEYDFDNYGYHLVRDFKYYRVFVDIDVFMKRVLHVPDNWKELWGPTIGRIKRDPVFSTAHWDYSRQCGTQRIDGRFCKSLVDMGNTIPHIRSKQHKGECSEEPWAQPLKVLEVEPWSDNALVDGSCMPRLKVDGRDPQQDYAQPYSRSRYPKRKATSPTNGISTLNDVASAPGPPLSRKRPADEMLEPNRKSQKVHYQSTPGGASNRTVERKPRRPQTSETDRQKDAYLQVGQYLLDRLSAPVFRSHATIGLVDRDRIQFYHANHSVILVSSAINLSARDRTGGLDKFIAILIAFNRLSLRDYGILHNLHNGNLRDGNPHDDKLLQDNGNPLTSKLGPGEMRMLGGNRLEFGGNKKTGPFTLTYGKVISHEPSLAGRATTVLRAKCPKWNDIDLVVKISWPTSDRAPESDFLEKAIEVAESTASGQWAINHLPRVVFAQDVVFNSESTLGEVASLFDDAEFVDEEYEYERRTLRIIIQERLYPLKTLTDVKDIAQTLVDIACVHRWLYDHVGILHGDLSLNNIMCRIAKVNRAGVTEKKVYGVLTDYDLSLWTASLTPDYAKTLQQRTGTPPFMARELLNRIDTLHLYRHDVESLFYIILILATHYEIQAPKKGENGGVRVRQGLKKLPYQEWFDEPSYKALAAFKNHFLWGFDDLDLSPAFEDLGSWLNALHLSFSQGIYSKLDYQLEFVEFPRRRQRARSSGNGVVPTFDDETLGGHVCYSTLIDPVRNLRGKLEGLIIRYDPPPPAATGTAQAGA